MLLRTMVLSRKANALYIYVYCLHPIELTHYRYASNEALTFIYVPTTNNVKKRKTRISYFLSGCLLGDDFGIFV